MKEKQSKLHYAWIILAALCVIRSLSAAGINNTGGLFLKPVSETLGIGIGSLSIYFSVSSLATLIFMPIGGKVINRYPIKLVIMTAIVMQAGSFILLGFMNSVWGWYLLSVPMGIGGALLVNLIGPILVNRWFGKNPGTALGLLMASVGIFGAVIQPVVSSFIAEKGWKSTYILLGLIILVPVLVVNFLFMKDYPKDKGLLPFGQKESNFDNGILQARTGVTLKEARGSHTFYLLLFFMVSITAFGSFNQHLAAFGAELGYTASQVGAVLSIGMIGSTLGAILIGTVSDRIGALKTTLGISFLIFVSIFCLRFGGMSIWVFGIGEFLLGISGMGIPVLAPLLTRAFFGEKEYEVIYSNVMIGAPLATILLLPLYGFIFDILGSYNVVFVILTALMIIGTICIVLADHKKPI